MCISVNTLFHYSHCKPVSIFLLWARNVANRNSNFVRLYQSTALAALIIRSSPTWIRTSVVIVFDFLVKIILNDFIVALFVLCVWFEAPPFSNDLLYFSSFCSTARLCSCSDVLVSAIFEKYTCMHGVRTQHSVCCICDLFVCSNGATLYAHWLTHTKHIYNTC